MITRPASRSLAASHPILDMAIEWLRRLAGVAMVVGLGVVLGTQYVTPNKRVIAVMMAALVVGIAWRMSMVQGIGLLIFALLYPRGTIFGNTNFALVLIVMVLWFIRVAMRTNPLPVRTPVDVLVGGFIMSFVISFYNVEPQNLQGAFGNFQVTIASILVFYLIVNNIRTERDLMRFHAFQVFAISSACLLAVFELYNPGATLIPGWINFSATHGTEFNTNNVRVGGPFFDFELMSEYCALSLLLVVFLWSRATSQSRKIFIGALGVLVVFILFATVTRGAIMALGVGIVYLLFTLRRRIRLVPFVILTSLGVAGFLAMNFYVSQFTNSGDMIGRLSETRLIDGMPDSRAAAWTVAWERYLQHPIIGHGPFYSGRTGVRIWYWPHNVYLYIANLVGIVGLSFYLLLLAKLWRLSRPRTDDLKDPSYAKAFLIIANAQLLVFAVDQVKIDFLRNLIYQFQPWILFATIVVTHRIASAEAPDPSRAA